MIAPAELGHRHDVQKKQFGRNRDARGLHVSERAEALGRRVAIHIDDRQYSLAHDVLQSAEREYRAEQAALPSSLDGVSLEDLDLGMRIYQLLEDRPGIHTAADLAGMSDEDLRQIPNVGPRFVQEIREVCSDWLARLSAAK